MINLEYNDMEHFSSAHNRNRHHKSMTFSSASFRRQFLVPYVTGMKMSGTAPKINMAEGDIDDKFVIKLQQENTD